MLRLLASPKGLTLIEVMAALVILGIILVPVLGTFTTGAFLSAESRLRSQATAIGEAELEEYLAHQDPDQVADERDGFDIELESTEFDDELNLYQATITVSWDKDSGTGSIKLTTLYRGVGDD